MIPHLSERALIQMPHGRDAPVAAAILREAGFLAAICDSITGLVAEMEKGAGFGLLTEEAMATADLHALSAWIARQPEWSDFPFILVTQRGGGLERNPAARRYLEMLGNVTFLERPFHPTTLISLAQSARRGRRRQYEARARLDELHALAADLEKRVEERTAERGEALRQLHEAQKLETIGQLTGGVAHDFNNLLTPIIGALDLLSRKMPGDDPRLSRLIGNALQSGERAKVLVQRLLGFARRQDLQARATDVGALLDGMRDLIASSVGPVIEVHIRREPDLPHALADPNQLELAVLNLCVNARDAMPEGGRLTIALEEVLLGPGSEPRLSPGPYIRLSVIDAGVGMDSDTLAHAVEPFFSTKETGRGTGLGLSMVHGLAAQLGGGFRLTSAPGEGTRADLYLPVASTRAEGGAILSRRELVTPRTLRILLVDDEDLVREGTAEMLRDMGHEVHCAAGGASALAWLADGAPADVVVTDFKMPQMDGAELAAEVRRLRPDLPVLLITGYTGASGQAHDLPRLSKPFGLHELADALAALCEADRKVVPFRPR
ncbi:MAG TPA: response regulator [Allosphingosinicella sp.]|nr:response regulator [Allosphingosinicella sp.]